MGIYRLQKKGNADTYASSFGTHEGAFQLLQQGYELLSTKEVDEIVRRESEKGSHPNPLLISHSTLKKR